MPEIRQAVDDVIASAHGNTPGYWVATRNGEVLPFGDAKSFGSMAGHALNASIIGVAATPTGNGYWLLGPDGGIFSFGDAQLLWLDGQHPAEPAGGCIRTDADRQRLLAGGQRRRHLRLR